MERFDVKPEPEDAPDRGNFPKIGNSNYRFNLWYKFPKKVIKRKANDGLYRILSNYRGDENFKSNQLIDYMRESMSGIKLVEDFDRRDDYWSCNENDNIRCSYRVSAFIPERESGMDAVYAQEDMKSFDEIDYQKSGEWIAKMLEDLGAEIDVDKCLEYIKSQQAIAQEIIDSNEELIAIVIEANEKTRIAINGDKSKKE